MLRVVSDTLRWKKKTGPDRFRPTATACTTFVDAEHRRDLHEVGETEKVDDGIETSFRIRCG